MEKTLKSIIHHHPPSSLPIPSHPFRSHPVAHPSGQHQALRLLPQALPKALPAQREDFTVQVREGLHAYEDAICAICAMCHPREPINFHHGLCHQ